LILGSYLSLHITSSKHITHLGSRVQRTLINANVTDRQDLSSYVSLYITPGSHFFRRIRVKKGSNSNSLHINFDHLLMYFIEPTLHFCKLHPSPELKSTSYLVDTFTVTRKKYANTDSRTSHLFFSQNQTCKVTTAQSDYIGAPAIHIPSREYPIGLEKSTVHDPFVNEHHETPLTISADCLTFCYVVYPSPSDTKPLIFNNIHTSDRIPSQIAKAVRFSRT